MHEHTTLLFLQGKSWRNGHWKMMLFGNKIIPYSIVFLYYLYLVVFVCMCGGGGPYLKFKTILFYY